MKLIGYYQKNQDLFFISKENEVVNLSECECNKVETQSE